MVTIEPHEAKQATKELEDLMYDSVSIFQRNAIGTAIAALGLFVPEDVVQKDGQYFTGSCPGCGRMIEKGTTHCPNFRQALRWPERRRT